MSPTDPPLKALGGRAAPFDIKFDLKELLLCAEGAGDAFWGVVGPSLAEAPPPGLEAAIERFCEERQISPQRVGRALRVCRLLFREGARRDVPPEALAEDLAAIAPHDAEALVRLLVPRYREVAPMLRREILMGALTDHGSLLTQVSWRVDEMKLSQRGLGLSSNVALVTLTFVEGGEKRRVTMQVLPDMVAELRAMCDALS